ncbi:MULTISPECIES: hypothetical protein [unclassified Ruegeria]|uniref:hypothetical protein n=1 Tax=unclassified Ruegeria TaxID=2625375 RepID=UPI0014878A7D|nr:MULTISPECIES: hypothetical protein [unclassified Ruegeria]
MLEDKRKDLVSERQKQLLDRMVVELSRSHGDLYYHSTSQIALLLEQHIQAGTGLLAAEKDLLKDLSRRDIEIMLSLTN